MKAIFDIAVILPLVLARPKVDPVPTSCLILSLK